MDEFRTEYIKVPDNLSLDERHEFLTHSCTNETVVFDDIPMNLRVRLQGKYCSGICWCENCNTYMNEPYNKDYFVGFSTDKYGSSVIIWECPHCFEKNYYHLTESFYRSFLNCKEREKQNESK